MFQIDAFPFWAQGEYVQQWYTLSDRGRFVSGQVFHGNGTALFTIRLNYIFNSYCAFVNWWSGVVYLHIPPMVLSDFAKRDDALSRCDYIQVLAPFIWYHDWLFVFLSLHPIGVVDNGNCTSSEQRPRHVRWYTASRGSLACCISFWNSATQYWRIQMHRYVMPSESSCLHEEYALTHFSQLIHEQHERAKTWLSMWIRSTNWKNICNYSLM